MNKTASAPEAPVWHAIEAGAALRDLDSCREGLPETEAQRRLERHGPNTLPAPRRHGPWRRFLLQFHNVLIYALLASALITAWLGHWVDTAVILGVVLINALIGFFQEGRAEQAMDAIRRMLSPHAQVLRDGHRRELPAEALVPGDVVFLASGDKVPADLRLLEVNSLQIDESVLTGESQPVEKTQAPVAAASELGDRGDMA